MATMTPEMRAFEYATGLFAVLIGLAVIDVATSFHRLLRTKSSVQWDPLALLAALYVLCLVVAMWFDLWGVRNFGDTRHFLFYLALVAQFFILFLLAAASLPDEPRDGVNLKEYYSDNRRYFWILVTLFQIGYCAEGLFFGRSESVRLPTRLVVIINVVMFAPLAVSIALFYAKSRAVHYVGLILLFAIMTLHYVRASIN